MCSTFLKEQNGGGYFNHKEKIVKKQSKCPSMCDIKIMVCHTVEYYSAVKKKKEETTDAHSNLGESPENYAE